MFRGKKFLRNLVGSLLLLGLILTIEPQKVEAQSSIKVFVDGELMESDVDPIIVNSRVLVPFRSILESMGADEIDWIKETKEIMTAIDGNVIKLKIDDTLTYVNDRPIVLDSPPIVKDSRTLVPVRVIAESTGKHKIEWIGESKEVHIVRDESIKDLGGPIYNKSLDKEIFLGENLDEFIKDFGQPVRKDKSELGFTWYVYNQDLENYFQVAVYKDSLVGFLSNSTNWAYGEYKIGQINSKLAGLETVSYIVEDDKYNIDIYPDKHRDYMVSDILIYNKNFTEANYTKEVVQGMTLQFYDLMNVYRVRNYLKPLEIDSGLEDLAAYHADDMARNNFFSHTSSDGSLFEERARRILGTIYAGENISLRFTGLHPVESTNGLYNSPGHRANILRPGYISSGVAISFGSDEKIYYVQNFLVGGNGSYRVYW